ncbi:DUF2231 domain-containing protein [Streptomyces sp. NPDC002935]|uniref:DUF2231 domain-containing protein n=1 Tax=Streptomyces sp. NPDC002935 TaxID=3154545 RepID=UPI0033B351E8
MNTNVPTPVPNEKSPALATPSAWWLTALERIERWEGADPAQISPGRDPLTPAGYGARFSARQAAGPPCAPVLVHVPIGCWLSAAVLDIVPSGRRVPTTLTAVGLAEVAPAAIAGWANWADLPPERARVGLVHAVSNVAALACYTASLTARLRSHSAKGRLWSLGGLTAVAVSGALGGHVAYRRAAGAPCTRLRRGVRSRGCGVCWAAGHRASLPDTAAT